MIKSHNKPNKRIKLSLLIVLFTAITAALNSAQVWAHNHFTVKTVGNSQTNNADIILIPGLMSNGEVWQSTLDTIKDKHRVHVVSISGFADSQKPTNFSMYELQNKLIDFITEENRKSEVSSDVINKSILIGHSLGGFLAMSIALEKPELVSKVVSVDGLPYIGPIFTGTNQTTPASLSNQAERILLMHKSITQAQLAKQTANGIFIQATQPKHQKHIIDMAERSDTVTVGRAMHYLMSNDLRPSLTEIKADLLILGASGGFNDNSRKQAVEQLYKGQVANLPNAVVKMNTTSRHFIMYDDPKWLNDQITAFIKDKS
ncbi:hypothetical protein C1E23_15090 [Pseudoalteromonas phenolica]|uniref:AB hydrolase-1 domain-containing protein n=1 Tax=Pseudoalteromonas phenolica TaxID=161398 RepID=A0A4Q7IJA2_9GAMM|nr:alpha/beta hydrolase [Pseudoalteromonas phenolica]RZQ52214.1 hypothetical protein C1E23_15090 [Pseudoalteromonas phenolica]